MRWGFCLSFGIRSIGGFFCGIFHIRPMHCEKYLPISGGWTYFFTLTGLSSVSLEQGLQGMYFFCLWLSIFQKICIENEQGILFILLSVNTLRNKNVTITPNSSFVSQMFQTISDADALKIKLSYCSLYFLDALKKIGPKTDDRSLTELYYRLNCWK